MMLQVDLLLCSASPRRAALLRKLGVPFRVCPVNVPETPLPGEIPWNTARRLQALSGRTHRVHTAVALGGRGFLRIVTCTTEAEMRQYNARAISDSVASDEPMDKAGAYAIQDRALQPVRWIRGLYSNVVGLPLAPTARLLRHGNIMVSADVRQRAAAEEA